MIQGIDNGAFLYDDIVQVMFPCFQRTVQADRATSYDKNIQHFHIAKVQCIYKLYTILPEEQKP